MCAWEYQTANQVHKKQILVGVPHREKFSDKFYIATIGMQVPEGYMRHIMTQSGQPLDVGRNMMVTTALQRNWDYLYFIDQDVIIKPETLTDLIEARQPIVGSVYFNRAPPYNVVANINSNPLTRDEIVDRLNNAPNHRALMEVHEMGMGSILIDMRVFKRMAHFHNLEWFCTLRHPNILSNVEVQDTMISFTNKEAIDLNYKCKYDNNGLIAKFFEYRLGKYTEDALSEDYYFCKKARQCGFQIYLCLHSIVEHELSHMTINEQGITNTTVGAGEIQ